MPIQSEDLKLLKSQNMDDTPQGGGAMTGVEIVDGASNNIFPDTSTDDRAGGRVGLRKVYGIVHTDDTDTALGASFVILEPPADPMVHCSLFETPGWADERDDARELIERFLAKGPQLGCRLFGTHYAGSTLLRFYSPQPGSGFPAPGDAICLRNPGGTEQYVRVIGVALSEATYTVSSGGSSVQVACNLADCEISVALDIDFTGPPVALSIDVAAYAQAYSTAQAGGARFYGVKQLAADASIGDRSVYAQGGIFTPLVPAATLEEPIVDVYPLAKRQTLTSTALADVVLPPTVLTLNAGAVVRLPTAAEPGTVRFTHGATLFTSNVAGEVLQGSTVVGTVDFKTGTVAMSTTAPSYGSGSNVVTYKPATRTGASAHSREIRVTQPNQSLSWVQAFEPPPAPGTLSIAYMAQGRWYELLDNGTGKLVGADSSYGSGNLSFVSGSAAFTLGALPDVDSSIVMIWADANTTRAFNGAQSSLPARAHALITLPTQPKPGTLALAWSRGANNYTATVDATGAVTGPAQVGPVVRNAGGTYEFTFAPDTLPDTPVTVAYDTAADGAAFTNDGDGQYTLTGAPVLADSVRFTLLATAANEQPVALPCHSRGSSLYATWPTGIQQLVGTINHTTGALDISIETLLKDGYSLERVALPAVGGNATYLARIYAPTDFTLQADNVLEFGYLPATTAAATPEVATVAWRAAFTPPVGLQLVSSGLVFTWAGAVYWSKDGVLYRGWDSTAGSAPVVGSVSSDGLATMGAAPSGGSGNSIAVANMALDAAHGLDMFFGVFRTDVSPLKAGSFQLQAGTEIGDANSGGIISGDFAGTVDFQRGIVRWNVAGMGTGPGEGTPVPASDLTYNAVYLQYVPLDADLLGLETARLPIDGKVPIYRAGGQVLVHHTLPTVLPNPLVKDTAYDLGRERIAAAVVRTLDGSKVPASLYTVDFDNGEILFPVASDLTGLAQPFTVHNRIEDELMVLRADISGRLDLVAALTHDYPAGTSFVSSKLRLGDRFARVYNYVEQSAWTGVWADELIGSAPTASYNGIDYPIATTNRGAITERWAVIFTGATQVRVVGENVGQVLTNVSINALIEAINPQTGAPYFSIPALGWGGGWAVSNVLRFNTAAAGGPAWIARTILQGPPSVESDKFTLAFRADVDA